MPSPCDCLTRCGDDPGLKDGRATPCASLARWQEKERRIVRANRLLVELGYADMLDALEELKRLKTAQR